MTERDPAFTGCGPSVAMFGMIPGRRQGTVLQAMCGRQARGPGNAASREFRANRSSPRVLIPLLEIHQTADGTVTIPEPLRPHMGGRTRIEPPAKRA